jgi:two-component system chemotaxis response regulator CheY
VGGRDGLTKVKADPGVKLVVRDVNMPNMDGLTMAEKVRSERVNKIVNIICTPTNIRPP